MHPLYEDMFHERWGSLSYCDEKISACDLKPAQNQCGDHRGHNASNNFGPERQRKKRPCCRKPGLSVCRSMNGIGERGYRDASYLLLRLEKGIKSAGVISMPT